MVSLLITGITCTWLQHFKTSFVFLYDSTTMDGMLQIDLGSYVHIDFEFKRSKDKVT